MSHQPEPPPEKQPAMSPSLPGPTYENPNEDEHAEPYQPDADAAQPDEPPVDPAD